MILLFAKFSFLFLPLLYPETPVSGYSTSLKQKIRDTVYEKMKMRILQLCKKFPYPLNDGESIAVTNLSKALAELGCEVTLLSMNTSKHYFDPRDLPADYNHYKAMHFVDVNNHLLLKDAFFNLFSSESYHVTRFVNPDFEGALIKLLKHNTYDIIHIETCILAPYISIIRQHTSATIAMRAHNVEHEIWQRIADNTPFLPKRIYLKNAAKKLRNFEVNSLADYDILVPITYRDERIFENLGYKGKSLVTPIGIDGRDYEAEWSSYDKPISLSFIGTLDWMPNQEGLIWFLDNVWPILNQKYPKLEFFIAGRNAPKKLLELKIPNVTVHGEVESAREFINRHSVMIVPLLSGSGMRAKILEGMALGKVVLTTAVGVEGIEAKNRQEILIADTPEEFIQHIDWCFEHKNMLRQIGAEAQELIRGEYDNLNVAKRLLMAYGEVKKSVMEGTK
ncbi:MAG: glycosyltransferase involved in cell wall biosynthesis [Saprospiraceae bacterium]